MAALDSIPKGSTGKLNITHEGAMRFLVGLSWDARDLPKMDIKIDDAPAEGDTVGKIVQLLMAPFDFVRVLFLSFFKLLTTGWHVETLRKDNDTKGRDKQATQFDLDLDCYIFDDAMQLQAVISTEDSSLIIDPSRKVYHTGDQQGGGASGDAETIFVETHGLPANYRHFFFVAKSDSKFTLGEFKNPTIRLADSKTNNNALQNAIAPGASAPQSDSRASAQEYNYVFCHVWQEGEGWHFRNIAEYLGDDVVWEEHLPQLAPGF